MEQNSPLESTSSQYSATSAPSAMEAGPSSIRASQDVIIKLETVFECIVDALLRKQDQICIELLVKRHSGAPKKIAIKYPGNTSQESWRFCN